MGPGHPPDNGFIAAHQALDDDWSFLRLKDRPRYEDAHQSLRVVDLFSGAGGLTLGLAEAARRVGLGIDVRFAADSQPVPAAIYRANFPEATFHCDSVESVFDGIAGAPITAVEAAVKRDVGDVDFLVGGPPCQGFSDLNNHTRLVDGRNALYREMARAALVLRPRFVIIENVASIRRDRQGHLDYVMSSLHSQGYATAEAVLSLDRLGVAQKRKRHLLVAAADASRDVQAVLDHCEVVSEARNLEWAIGDLVGALDGQLNHAARSSVENRERIRWLMENEEFDLPNALRPACHRDKPHTYQSMYGRLRWDAPAQTITSGYGSMGQGRFVHPSEQRTLTPHEAARLQFIPDFFDFSACERRSDLADLIGNVAPPKMAMVIAEALLADGELATPRPLLIQAQLNLALGQA